MSAIPTDAPDFDPADSGFDAFLKRLVPTDADKPSGDEDNAAAKAAEEEAAKKAAEESNQPKTEEGDEPSAEKPDGEDAEKPAEGDEQDASKLKFAEDDSFVKVRVGDEEHAVSVKDLTRLFGQEKSLTQKSMEVAEQRKTLDGKLAEQATAYTALLERAKQRFEPYSKIDFMLAAKDLTTEEYNQLRQAAQAAYEDMTFLQNGLNSTMQQAQERQHNALVEQAKQSLKVLGGPVDQGGIEGFNEKLYDDIRDFGAKQGLSQQIIHNLVDPVAIRLMHSAMLYERGKSKVTTVKINKTPTKIVKTSTTTTATSGHASKAEAAKAQLQKSGSTDDAANLFLAQWADRDAEQS